MGRQAGPPGDQPAINRQDLIDKIYGGDAAFSAEVPPGYGDWPIPEAELKEKYFKYDLEKAKQLMSAAGFANGFSVELQAIATQEYTPIAEVLKEQLSAIKIDVKVQPLEIGTFAKNNADGTFEWHQTGRGMRATSAIHRVPHSGDLQGVVRRGVEERRLTLIDQGIATVGPPENLYRGMREI